MNFIAFDPLGIGYKTPPVLDLYDAIGELAYQITGEGGHLLEPARVGLLSNTTLQTLVQVSCMSVNLLGT